jgi:exosome complex RNA-binding protein Rrp4
MVVEAGREREAEMEVEGARVKRLERGVVVRTPKVNSPISLGMLALG